MSGVFNLLDGELVPRQPEPGQPARDGHRFLTRGLGAAVGATLASMSVYELPPGQAGADYHFELSREEWLLVVSGEVTLRTPAGERVLRAGDVVCFPAGPEGAHAMRNDGDVVARYAVPSTASASKAVVYPDRGRIAVFGPGFEWEGDL